MAKNITIAGASYSGVPALEVPLTAGGTTRFLDCVGSQTISQNGTVTVAGLAEVVVNVPQPTTALSITVQPVSITIPTDATAVFAVDAVGDGLTYQWQWRDKSTSAWANSSSATVGYNTAILRPVGTTTRNGYQYQCVVKDSHGNSVTSSIATLTVKADSGGGGMNVQCYHGYATVTSTSYTATAVKLTVAKTGTYKVSWTGWRNTNSGTSGSQLYIAGKAYGAASTSFLNTYGHSVTLTGVSLTAGQEIVVRARARSTSYVMAVGNLCIEQTA